jgi:5-methyltetrahydrofolate--homocysteine methyltransferase
MGTQLVQRGLRGGEVPELWNVDRPADVAGVHRAYVAAGCELITTNSFGASSVALARHGLESRTYELNFAAARLAREAAGDSRYVLGDIGPSTQMIEPYGDLSEDAAMSSFAQQASALLEGGADGFIIETMGDPNEMSLAIRAARQVSQTLPIIATFAFSRDASKIFRTMMGTTVIDAMRSAADAGADVVGANCGTNLSLPDYLELATTLLPVPGAKPVIVQPNAGSPKLVDGRNLYDATPEAMATLATQLASAGVRVIGGCCGTTPAHLEAMAGALRGR